MRAKKQILEEVAIKHYAQEGEISYNMVMEAMEEYAALRQPVVSGSLGFDEGYEKGWTDATSQAINEIQKNYKPNDR